MANITSVMPRPIPYSQGGRSLYSTGRRMCFPRLTRARHTSRFAWKSSREYVVINTHKGLFHYTRLPFEVISAPGIFQRLMESLLQGLPGVIVCTDDILIAGADEKEHLERLEAVLSRLERAGLRERQVPV